MHIFFRHALATFAFFLAGSAVFADEKKQLHDLWPAQCKSDWPHADSSEPPWMKGLPSMKSNRYCGTHNWACSKYFEMWHGRDPPTKRDERRKWKCCETRTRASCDHPPTGLWFLDPPPYCVELDRYGQGRWGHPVRFKEADILFQLIILAASCQRVLERTLLEHPSKSRSPCWKKLLRIKTADIVHQLAYLLR
jgi:hypothetical protein